jgi:hypothetical protein
MSETQIDVISYRAFLTQEVIKTTLDDMFTGAKFIGIKARKPDYAMDWKAGEKQQMDIDFRLETLTFKGTVLLADLENFTTNETTKHSILGPFTVRNSVLKAEPGTTIEDEVDDTPEIENKPSIVAVSQSAPTPTTNPRKIQPNQYNGIDSPGEYVYDHATLSAAFKTINQTGEVEYWIATGTEAVVKELVQTKCREKGNKI